MKHFSEAQWADFARNVTLPTTKVAMQQHVDDGCGKCSETLQIWQSVFAIAGRESGLTPPDDMVRVVKSQFAVLGSTAGSGVRLVFDSMLQPMTAGIRGSVTARQFLYETDEYYIDLRLEPRPDTERACLVGQVLSRAGSDRITQGVAVRLQDGRLPMAHTSTNEFGEFELEFEAADSPCVAISRDAASDIVLPLYGLQGKVTGRKPLD